MEQIAPESLERIDYLDVARTACALTVMYGQLLSLFAIQAARSEHAWDTMHSVKVSQQCFKHGFIPACPFFPPEE